MALNARTNQKCDNFVFIIVVPTLAIFRLVSFSLRRQHFFVFFLSPSISVCLILLHLCASVCSSVYLASFINLMQWLIALKLLHSTRDLFDFHLGLQGLLICYNRKTYAKHNRRQPEQKSNHRKNAWQSGVHKTLNIFT